MFDLDQVPVPDLNDPQFAPFWAGTREGKLRIQQCSDCKTYRWPPRITCRHCRSMKSEWVEVEPRGTLYTYTVVGRATAKGYSNVPYTVGFVTLDAHPNVRIIGNVVDVEPSAVRIGMPLKARFVPAGPKGEMTLIHWTPA
jgi:uncharacterized OB-fold protein